MNKREVHLGFPRDGNEQLEVGGLAAGVLVAARETVLEPHQL